MPSNFVYLRINATLLSLCREWAEVGRVWGGGGVVRAAVACVEQWTIHKPKVKRLKIIEQHQSAIVFRLSDHRMLSQMK